MLLSINQEKRNETVATIESAVRVAVNRKGPGVLGACLPSISRACAWTRLLLTSCVRTSIATTTTFIISVGVIEILAEVTSTEVVAVATSVTRIRHLVFAVLQPVRNKLVGFL